MRKLVLVPTLYLSLAIVFAADLRATVNYVQGAAGGVNYGADTLSVPFPADVGVGHVVAFAVHWTSSTASLSGVTDSKTCGGNTYTLADATVDVAAGSSSEQGWAVLGASGPCTLNFSFDGTTCAHMGCSAEVHEISGVDPTFPVVDHRVQKQVAPGPLANAVSSGRLAPADGGYIFAWTFDASGNNATWNPGPGFTMRQANTALSRTSQTEDRVPPYGSIVCTFTATAGGGDRFMTGAISFVPAPPGAPAPDSSRLSSIGAPQ